MTYRGHSVLQTLCRCHFSPAETTGQRYIYTGCAAGRVIGTLFKFIISLKKKTGKELIIKVSFFPFFLVYDSLTGKIEKELTGHRACVRDVSWHPYRPEITSVSVS